MISSGEAPSDSATALAVRLASTRPGAPVHAFALPALTTAARTRPPATFARETTTGAAATAFVVKTAAAGTGSAAAIIATSSLPDFLMPAATPEARKPCGAVTPPSVQARSAAMPMFSLTSVFSSYTTGPTRSSPAVSANPRAMFAHWIAWPPDPFTRLSIAHATTSVPDARRRRPR